MKLAYINELNNFIDQDVEIRGWVYNRRSSGKVRFLLVRDGTGIVQCVLVKGQIDDELFEGFDELSQETSIIITGTVNKEKRAPGGVEIFLKDYMVVNRCENYPISLKEHGVGFLMKHRHLWLRSRKQAAIARIRSDVVFFIREFFNNRGFVLVDAPILTPSACEGTTTLFKTDYFGQDAFLSQSGQLYMEAACMALGKVYCFGPTFRAEKSKTRRHLMEFWMVEPEVAYMQLDEDMDLAEDLVMYIVERTLDKDIEQLKILERDISKLEKIKRPFPRIHYDEAIKLLKQKGFDISWGDDFGGDEETALSENFDSPIFIHRFPAESKAFYMRRDPEDERYSLSCDMIAPEGYGEIVGGGEREYDLGKLLESLKIHNLPEDSYDWYLDLRRYGSVPHAGFGLGLERVIAWLCGIHHVRETIAFPRMLDRIWP